jgi:ABC-type nitrate/sulfonate/bicarbonate transport system permease component
MQVVWLVEAVLRIEKIALSIIISLSLKFLIQVENTDTHVVPQCWVVFKQVWALLKNSECLLPLVVFEKRKSKVEQNLWTSLRRKIRDKLMGSPTGLRVGIFVALSLSSFLFLNGACKGLVGHFLWVG